MSVSKPAYNPLELTERVREFAIRIRPDGLEERRYYRFRGGLWYGGIATGDVVGCNLRCGFCWSWREASHRMSKGFLCKPDEVFRRLVSIAEKHKYKLVRLSGGEPTISKNHILRLLELFQNTDFTFILETNGILIGSDNDYAKELSQYSNLIVRVSIKGSSREEFHILTLADPVFFEYQLKALKNLVDAGLEPGRRVYPAVMLSFSTSETYENLKARLADIHPKLSREIDEEYVILYPHVVELLKSRGLNPKIAYKPEGIPVSMI
ncbi:MAG: radical SAM protein [Candidatus Brockarchaeota archaeon]|nr:radical SAM protein [Candidatus Brockarchaeota archaeon]MBO3840752.1 radical SAM protein [Candidatus Brockarchaeota archaeon]